MRDQQPDVQPSIGIERAFSGSAAAPRCAACAFVLSALCVAALPGCATVPPRTPIDPAGLERGHAARRLPEYAPPLAATSAPWSRAQWLNAALSGNAELAEVRARAWLAVAHEHSAAERPNPTLSLFGQYVTAAAGGAAWLYGLSLDFLWPRAGERARLREAAALQTEAAQADVAEAIWQVRTALRQALLDVVASRDEAALLGALLVERQAQVGSAEAQARAGEIAEPEAEPARLALASVQQRAQQAQARGADAQARLAAALGVPLAALDGVAPQWPGWSDLNALALTATASWREDALVARPELVRALREYDLAEIALQDEYARRRPEIHLTPGLAWDRGGVHENQFNENLHDNELGVVLEAPLFNRHQGPIGEARARRAEAARHVESVQAQLREQLDRAERAWPLARQAWVAADTAAAATARQSHAAEHALSVGAADRSTVTQSRAAALEARLSALQAAYEAQQALAALEAAYRRPLEGSECELPLTWRAGSRL